MNSIKKMLAVLLLAVIMSATAASAVSAISAEQISNKAKTAGFNSAVLIKNEILPGTTNIRHIQADLYDLQNPLPVRADILWNFRRTQDKNIYLHPGAGLSFEANFLAKPGEVINRTNEGYLVIGVSPREAQGKIDMDMAILQHHGLPSHTSDFAKVITLVQSISNLPFEVGGHSAGAHVALHEAALLGNSNPKFKAVRIIDMGAEYPPGSVERANAIATSQAITQLMNQGVHVNLENVGFKQLADMARLDPTGDSGVSREDPLVGNFTNSNLLNFSLIFSGSLPGTYTELTGLPGSWYLKQGYLAGTYEFNPTDPLLDSSALTYTKINTLYAAMDTMGSGIFPLAFDRNINDVWSGVNPIINWANIKVPVYWINTECGFGDTNPTSLLSGSPQLIFKVKQGYCHADPVYADNAATDFWPDLFPGIF